jgi:hypothetical protein
MKFELKPHNQKLTLKRFNRNITDEELLNDLRRVATQFGGQLTGEAYSVHGKFSMTTCGRRFGSWNKALIAAGVIPTKVNNITDDALFENIEEVWLKLGRQPKYSEIKAPLSLYSAGVYEDRFGSWYKALERFVEVANRDPSEMELNASVVENIEPVLAHEATENQEQVARNEDDSKTIEEKDIIRHKTKRNINWRMRWQVLDRDNFRCMSCGLSPAIAPGTILHVDHIKPWSKGGETVLENLQTLCATCNLGKSNIE